MIIKTRKQILRDMIGWMRNNNSSLTDFNQGSVIRALLGAVAAVLAQLYYHTHKTNRSARIIYANRDDLDIVVAARGITRRGATKATVADVTFTAVAATEIPVGFKVATENGIEFVTTETGTVAAGESYIDLDVEAVVAGTSGNVRAEAIDTLIHSLTGVSAVINNNLSNGGFEAETDEILRNRAITQLSTLSMGIQASYEAWAREARSDVIRAIGQANHPAWGDKIVVVHLVKDNAGAFTSEDLNQIAAYIQIKAPLGVKIICLNVVWTNINLTAQVRRQVGVNLNTVKDNIQTNIKIILDYRDWEWGTDVEWSDIFAMVSNSLGVDEVEKAGFVPGSNVGVSAQSLPRFNSITITDW